MLDLHIHDADYVHYVFGMPKEVFSRGVIGPSQDFDHCITQYLYDDEQETKGAKVISAEGGWIMAPDFGFALICSLLDNSTRELVAELGLNYL